MAIFIVENSGKVGYGIKRYICKTMEDIPVEVNGEEIAPGSKIYVTDEKKTYMLNTVGQWVEITEGSGGGGASSIDQLSDVTIASPQEGQILAYDETTGTWVNVENSANDKMDKVNPTGSGSFSLNRKADTAIGSYSFAEGLSTTASGSYAHAEGSGTIASGDYSHAEGCATKATGLYAHAEGSTTTASAIYSHAEGETTIASGPNSHSEGMHTKALGHHTHTENNETEAKGSDSHAEGHQSKTTEGANAGHAEGYSSIASGNNGSHAEGYGSQAKGGASHAENNSIAEGQYSHSEGSSATTGQYSHAEGLDTKATASAAHSEGGVTTASGIDSHAEGSGTTASGENSHAEGSGGNASGVSSHKEGNGTNAIGDYSHAEGNYTNARGNNSHTEGSGTTATGTDSHAEGAGSQAVGNQSHAEGAGSVASGLQSHAEGAGSRATGAQSHAEGNGSLAVGDYSHSEGHGTIAAGQSQHAGGKYNVGDNNDTYAEIIGNGTADDARSNARTLDWQGNEVLAGDLIINGNRSVGNALNDLAVIELTQAEYNALTPEEKLNGTEYFITDGTNPPVEAASILYDNEDSGLVASDVQNAIDELNYNMSNLSGANYTDLVDTLKAGETSITITDSSITTDSTIDFYTDVFGVNPIGAVVGTGQITLTFEERSSDLGVKVRVWDDGVV